MEVFFAPFLRCEAANIAAKPSANPETLTGKEITSAFPKKSKWQVQTHMQDTVQLRKIAIIT